ncbi:MAG: prolipoprotein diacylglyceryl transferase [Clostridia bacterium]|nr:prolipoprotein diacylglyceryl transferase [Clostridia bacterium]
MREEIVNISFPGLGIDEFSVNKIAFTLFGKLEVRWYGILITCGIVLAFLYTIWRGKKNERIIADDIIDIGLLTVVMGVIGARLYYVLTDSGNSYHSLMDVIAVWNGGLGIYGGIIGGCLGIVIACAFKKISWRKLFDMAAPGVMIAQALGRWGNFCNGEAYGYQIADTTRFYFFNQEHLLPSGEGTFFHTLRMGLTPNIYSTGTTFYFHPTFLYESLWNILGFVLINLYYKHKKFDGQVALFYFMWYGFGRMFIEGLRTDSLYLPGTSVRMSQLVGLICFAVGAVLFVTFWILCAKKQQPVAVAAGEGVCANASDPMTADADAGQEAEPSADGCDGEQTDDGEESSTTEE